MEDELKRLEELRDKLDKLISSMSEEELRRLADLRLKLEEKIKTLQERLREIQEELDLYKQVIKVVDESLARFSFMKASQVPPPEEAVGEKTEAEAVLTRRELRRQRDGLKLAEAKITNDKVVVDINPEIAVKSNIPPFRSFFVRRTLEEMRRKDREEVSSGRKPPSRVLDYTIEELPDGTLKRITILNPGDKTRVNEILNILTWTLTKMLEKIEKKANP